MLRCFIACAALATVGTPRPIPLPLPGQRFHESASSQSGEENSEWENNNVGAEQSSEEEALKNLVGGRRDYEPSPEDLPPFKYPWTGSAGQWAYYVLWGWPHGTYPPREDDYDYYDSESDKKKANFEDPEWAEDLIAHQIYALGYTTPVWFRPETPRKVIMPMFDRNARCSMFRGKHSRVADFIGRVLADVTLNFWLMDSYVETQKKP